MPKNKKILIFSLVFAFLLAGLSIATAISNLLYRPATANSSGVSVQELEIHFISLNKSQLESSAKALAGDYQAIGAGGYTWQIGDYYHVLSSGFENKSDAVLVQSNLATSNIQSEITSVKFDSFAINGNFNPDEKKVLQKAVTSFENTYKTLYDVAISLDTAVYNEVSARLAVNSAHSNLNSVKADFDIMFSSTTVPALKTLSTQLARATKCTTLLCSGTLINKNQTYSSLIKYRYIELLNIYQTCITELKKTT